jgi:acetolactate synthase-1/2/3 large subunit
VEKELPLRNSDAVPIHPLRLAKEINDFLTEDTIVVADGGDVASLAAGVIQLHKPGHWLDPGPLGTLGVGLAFALAAKTAFPDKEVLVVFGDGAFGLNGFEFDTCVRHNLPVIAVVGTNGTWGMVRYGRSLAMAKPAAISPTFWRRRATIELSRLWAVMVRMSPNRKTSVPLWKGLAPQVSRPASM